MKKQNHKSVRRQLPFFIEGRLPEAEQQHIDAHLRACGDCRAYVEELQKNWNLLAQVNQTEAGPYFVAGVKNRLKARSSRASVFAAKAWQPAFVLVLLVLGVRLGIWIGSSATQPMEATEQAVLLPFDDLEEEPIEAFLLNLE